MKVLIICGPTREYIDDVRFISNASSGRMGAALAREALARNHDVRIVSGPLEVRLPRGAEVTPVTSAREMHSAAISNFDWADIVLMPAAVADWRPLKRVSGKMKKNADAPEIKLKKNPDILAALGRKKKKQVLVGFALESNDIEKNARGKLNRKKADIIVANSPSAIGSGNSSVLLIDRGGVVPIGPASKRRIAADILDAAEKLKVTPRK